MLCQSCRKYEAIYHVRILLNDEPKNYMVCEKCFKRLEEFKDVNLLAYNMENLSGTAVGDLLLNENANCTKTLKNKKSSVDLENLRCKECGCTFNHVLETKKVGCPECYKTFKSSLLPVLEYLHGGNVHIGKTPSSASGDVKLRNEIKVLQAKLKEAVDKQEFEKAAKLRDQIKEIEGQVHKDGE